MKFTSSQILQIIEEELTAQEQRTLKSLEKMDRLAPSAEKLLQILKKKEIEGKREAGSMSDEQAERATTKIDRPPGSDPVIKQVRPRTASPATPAAPTEPQPVEVDWDAESWDEPEPAVQELIDRLLDTNDMLDFSKTYQKLVKLTGEDNNWDQANRDWRAAKSSLRQQAAAQWISGFGGDSKAIREKWMELSRGIDAQTRPDTSTGRAAFQEIYVKAVRLAIEEQEAGETMFVRELGVNYTLAKKITDKMQSDGFAERSKTHRGELKILVSSEDFEKLVLKLQGDPDNPLMMRGTQAQRAAAAQEKEKEMAPIPSSKLPPRVQHALVKSLGVHFKKLKQAGIDPDKLYAAFNDFMEIITDGKLTDDEADKLLSAAGVEIDQGPSTAPLIPDEEKEEGGFTPYHLTAPQMTPEEEKRIKHINLNVPKPPGGGLSENSESLREEIGAALAGILSAVRSGNRDEDEEEEG